MNLAMNGTAAARVSGFDTLSDGWTPHAWALDPHPLLSAASQFLEQRVRGSIQNGTAHTVR